MKGLLSQHLIKQKPQKTQITGDCELLSATEKSQKTNRFEELTLKLESQLKLATFLPKKGENKELEQ